MTATIDRDAQLTSTPIAAPMPQVKVHRSGECDLARRRTLRSILTARYWLAEGDRRAAARALTIAHQQRQLLVTAKAAHADCCPSFEIHPNRPVRLPSGYQLEAIGGPIETGRYLP